MRLVAQPLHEIEHGIARLQFERLAAGREEGLAAGVALRPLGDGDQRHVGEAERGERRLRGGKLPAAAVDDDEIGPGRVRRLSDLLAFDVLRRRRGGLPLPACGERVGVRGTLADRILSIAPLTRRAIASTSPRKRGEVTEPAAIPNVPSAPATAAAASRRHRGDSVISRLKRRSSTSRIIAKSSPGVSSAERMLNLRYWFFWKPSGPATTMAPTAFDALDVAVVVDLDAARRAREPEAFGERIEQLALRRGVGELAAQRLARIGERVIDQFLLLAALAACAISTLRPLLVESACSSSARSSIVVRDQDQLRHRLVVVELREERAQHLAGAEACGRPWGNRRGCPSSGRCGRRTPRRRRSRPPGARRRRRLLPSSAD